MKYDSRWPSHRTSCLTHLKTAKKGIIDIVVEQFLPSILLAGPTPQVLAVAGGFLILVERSCNDPHYETECEEADRKDRVIHSDLLGTFVPALPVAPEHDQAGQQRYAGNR